MAEQEYTPTLADMLEGLVYSQLEIGKRGHGDMDLAVAEQELRRRWAEALAAHDAWVRADERAKQPDREQIKEALAKVLDGQEAMHCTRVWEAWSYNTMTADDFSLVAEDDAALEELADAVLSSLALEPEARKEKPPVHLASDLWSALRLPDAEFDGYYERNGWADTWSNLLAEVRLRSGARSCGEDADGEPCVLMTESHLVHYGASDVGSSEPLPAPEAREEPSTAVRALHYRDEVDAYTHDISECECVEGMCPTASVVICHGCWDLAEVTGADFSEGISEHVLWPCATVKALDAELARAPEAREVTDAEVEAEAREMYAADESEHLGRWPEWDSPKNVCKARYLERAEAALEAALEAAREARNG
ncbi:hypothetical protein [Pseudoclavibacter helvolus]|uniref:hypothetical protein n=1 Tax=Pseudoclavibacter helvolus TaxID=255205 RepID=UPI0035EB935A